MAGYLSEDGHNVSFLTNTKMMPYVFDKTAQKIYYEVPHDIDSLDSLNFLDFKMTVFSLKSVYDRLGKMTLDYCESLMKNEQLLSSMKSENYDLLIADSVDECGRLFGSYLGAPVIVYSNMGFLSSSNIVYPKLNSISCSYPFICRNDNLSFFQRVSQLMVEGFLNFVVIPDMWWKYKQLSVKYNIPLSMDLEKVYENSIMIINGDFVSEFPRPLMPNQVMLSGMFHEKADKIKPLPKELDEFVKDASEGLIVFSFGTLMSNMTLEKASIFAKVFSKLSQKIIWSYKGEEPPGLAKNTMIMGWIPQNDLLAHPNTKIFITHCGISGVYEALYNAVPVLAIPLFMDQDMNAYRLVERRGMGVLIESFSDINEVILEKSIKELLHNPKYKNNAIKTSQMIQDTSVEPRKQFLHLVNYTIKYDGARHLVSEPLLNMNLFQLYSADVVLFLMLTVSSVSLILLIILKIICCKICHSIWGHKKKRD